MRVGADDGPRMFSVVLPFKVVKTVFEAGYLKADTVRVVVRVGIGARSNSKGKFGCFAQRHVSSDIDIIGHFNGLACIHGRCRNSGVADGDVLLRWSAQGGAYIVGC